MSLENTVLTTESIKELLSIHYGITADTVEKIDLGTANCYRVSNGGERYFVKEFQSDINSGALVREAEIVNYLANRDIPTAKYIKAVDGELFIIRKNHMICLEEYIDGVTYGYNNFPKSLMLESAGMLGKIHESLSGYKLPAEMGEEWLNSFSVGNEQKKYAELLEILENHNSDKNYERIKNDLIYKQQLLCKGNEFKGYFKGITYAATHGDYQGCQLICENGHIKAVIDFSSARILPKVWEVMRSYVQTSEYCRNKAKIDIEEFCGYVREYMKYSELKKRDLEAMPYVYLFQLARSKYGYPQYLTTDSEDRERLLQFAFWRTDICREIYRKAAKMQKVLQTLPF